MNGLHCESLVPTGTQLSVRQWGSAEQAGSWRTLCGNCFPGNLILLFLPCSYLPCRCKSHAITHCMENSSCHHPMPLGHCTKATTMAQDAGINHSQPHVAAAVVLQKQPTKVHPPTRDTCGVSGRISGHPVLRANPSALALHRVLHSAPGSGI